MILNSIGYNIIIPLVILLIIQDILAIYTLMKLFKNKPSKAKSIIWNIIIVLVVIIGPIMYLIIERPNKSTNDESLGDEKADYSI